MDWQNLLAPARFGQKEQQNKNLDDIRSEFQRDYDRIIFSSPFRRLQNKTQVFPLPGSVFVHNRLTHSLEVASVGRSLGNIVYSKISHLLDEKDTGVVREIDTVIATACLVHDLGNPPFGHSGEKSISHFFSHGKGKEVKAQVSEKQYADLTSFEGNANLLRLLTHQFQGRRKGGYVLTYASLGTMIKYPYDSTSPATKGKFGFFQTEKDTFDDIMQRLQIPVIDKENVKYARHPLVYLVEAADDICYQVMDLEDAHKLNIQSKEQVQKLFMAFFHAEKDKALIKKINFTLKEVTDSNEQIAFLRAMVIGKLVNAAASVFEENYQQIMQGTFSAKILDLIEPTLLEAMKTCKRTSIMEVYKHPSVVKIEISGYNVIGALLDEFYQAIFYPDSDYSQKILSLMPKQYDSQSDDLYLKARSLVDFISGMTDVYAVDLFKQIKGYEL